MGKERVEWEALADIARKISDEADRLDWAELMNEVSDAYEESVKEDDPAIKLFVWQQFLFRLLYRVRKFDRPYEFNRVSKTSRLEKHKTVDMFMIENYDHKMYLWAKKKGYTKYLTNNFFLVPVEKLTDKERESFDKKCENSF